MDKQWYVYIMTNFANTVLYTGMTNDLHRRVGQHKRGSEKGFSCRYNVKKLVYFEIFADPYGAIVREKQIKAGSRRKKIALIEGLNPCWRDLAADLDDLYRLLRRPDRDHRDSSQ